MKISIINEIPAANQYNNLGTSSFFKCIYFAVLLSTLAYFCVVPLRDIQMRHVIVFLGTVLFYILAIYRLKQSRYKLNLILRIFVIIGLISAGVLISSTEDLLKLIYSSLNYLAFFILMSTDNPIVLTERMMKWTIRIFLLMAFSLFITANSSVAYLFENGLSTTALVLGMTNPNFTAMMILGVSTVLLIGVKEARYRINKIVMFSVLVGLGYLLWLTQARSSVISFIIVVGYYLFFSNKKVSNFVVVTVFIGVLLFMPLYIHLYSFGGDYEFMGKNFFSGRVQVYNEYLQLLNTKYYLLFGNLGAAQFANAHNAPLAIMASLGVIGLVVSYCSYFLQLIKMNNKAVSSISRLAIVSLLCMYVQSSAEALFFLGVYPGISFMFLYTVFANSLIKK